AEQRQRAHGVGRVGLELLVDDRPQRLDGLGEARLAGGGEQLDRGAQLLGGRVAAGGVAEAEQVRRAAFLHVPGALRGAQALVGERVAIAAQGAARRGQGRRRAVVERGGRRGERPAVVGGG